jgi:hypothetical protein
MTAGDRNAGRGADRRAPFQDALDNLERQPVDRHANDGKGKDRRPAHCIDVRKCVGCGDAAKIEGIIDDRHEKIRRHDHGEPIAYLIDGGIVSRLRADQQVREAGRLRDSSENSRKH